MGTLLVYMLKTTVCLALFYLFYRLLLSRETFHRFNRIALLSILLLSLLIPLIEVTTIQQTEVGHTMLTLEQLLMMADMQGSTTQAASAEEVAISGIQVVLLLYLAGILFFAFRNLYSLSHLVMLLRSGKREKMEQGVVLVIHQKAIAPFSWMKYIVISEKDIEENGREILIHERAHIRNYHSIDLLIADISIFFQWFNPAAWLLKQELQNIHEYEADETVIKEGIDAKQYQLLLIKKAVGTRLYSMANSFNHSKLKKRITMMLKEKSSPWARLKYLYILPLAAIAVTAFARPEIAEKAEAISVVKVNDLAAIMEVKMEESLSKVTADTSKTVVKQTEVFTDVEQMPEFPGGTKAMIQFIKDNMKYPAKAKVAGTQARVIVQFVVDKSGKITAPRTVRSIDAELDKEAIRLVKSMPNWIPGKKQGKEVAVTYTIPIMFRLKGNETVATSTTTEETMDDGKKPLIVIDGKEVSSTIMGAIDPSHIESISILKDASAMAIYGDKGKDGVVVITLKHDDKQMSTQAGKIEIVEMAVGKATKISHTPIEMDKVSGLVKSTDGSPVVGAIILVEGTTDGTVTDKNGAFTMDAPKDATLVVSYIGMSTEKVKAASNVTAVLKNE